MRTQRGRVLIVRGTRRVPLPGVPKRRRGLIGRAGSRLIGTAAAMVQQAVSGPVFQREMHLVSFNCLAETEHQAAALKEIETWAWCKPREVLLYPLNSCIVRRAEYHLRGIHG